MELLKQGLEASSKINQITRFLFFSGHVDSYDPFDAEWKACKFLIDQLWLSSRKHERILICSDNSSLIHFMIKMKAGMLDHDISIPQGFKNKVMGLKVSFKFISRNLNRGADDLAMRGKSRQQILWAWCI
ncbi:hypothetical protein POM88_046536 [Heracleum sosnowskyi]|uniref:Uncharacterized protein n=1 Tax=Heracleum sosnowskyi TaxID=360622 RepID=A0AAD8H6E6_9APIA|nr:hypothetical protein POM88_046536 [Heracleum sosnowskyi]